MCTPACCSTEILFLDQVTGDSLIQTETAGRLDSLKEADIKCNMHLKTLSEICLLTVIHTSYI